MFLVSDEVSFVNGYDMIVDGGMMKVYVIFEGFVVFVFINNVFKDFFF